MENTNQFTLVQGKFTLEDAKSILLNFYNAKINFHHLQLLGIHEGRQGNTREIEQKVLSLKQTMQAILVLLSVPDPTNQTVEIEGYITIKK